MNTFETLQREWSDKNPGVLSDYTQGSHRVMWWKCAEGHEWQAEIRARYRGNGCPYCSGRNAITGVTDFTVDYPELLTEWDVTKNSGTDPATVKPHSSRRFWWKCREGHEWLATPADRVRGRGCPVCANHFTAVTPENSLAAKHPQIAAEWDYEKNTVLPTSVLPSSNKYFYWCCKKGHKWSSTVNTRSRKDRPGKCPYCTGKRVVEGENDLLSQKPEVASEWDSEKNKTKPNEVACYSKKYAWWKCPKGHSYKAMIYNKSYGRGCPYCAGKKVMDEG